MDAKEFIKNVFYIAGMQISDERVQSLGAPDGLYPLLTQLAAGLHQVDTEQYEPLEKPDFFKERSEK